MSKIIAIILCVLFPFQAFALSSGLSTACLPKGQRVFYINGVNKPDEQQVRLSAMTLEITLKQFNVADTPVAWFWNPSEGLILDVFSELAAQKAAA